MNDLLRSFVRALANAFHPRMLWLTFMPFAVATVAWGAVLWFFWQTLTGAARNWLDGWALTSAMYRIFDSVGFSSLHAVIAPFFIVIMVIPLIVVTILLLIATLSMPSVIKLLTRRQYASLEMRRGGSWYGSLGHSVVTTVVCLVLLVVTLPLWLIPPFFAIIPPVLWGWLTYRVMTYDALALHASAEERRTIVRHARWPLFGIGVVSGLLGSLPTMLWAWSVWLLPLFPVVAAATIWIYAFILVFSALWFAHYCLHALERLRIDAASSAPPLSGPGGPAELQISANFYDLGAFMGFGVIIIGDEILSGRRTDKHLPKVIELLSARGLSLDWAEYIGDDRERITATLKRAFVSGDVVFSTGGIGATPDDHTRQCAAAALGVPLELHPEAAELIRARIRETAGDKPADLNAPDNLHRLNMGTFPQGASIIPNSYNRIPGFSVGNIHFVPGFPVMAWPMIEWVLDNKYAELHHATPYVERSLFVFGLPESRITPLMESIEREFAGVRVFSLPSVGDVARGEVFGRAHIDLGVKGEPEAANAAFERLREGVAALGGEIVEVEPGAAQ